MNFNNIRSAARVTSVITALALALAVTVFANVPGRAVAAPAPASTTAAAQIKCGKASEGWMADSFANDSKETSKLPSNVGYSIQFSYCRNIFTTPTAKKVFPGGIKVSQNAYAGTWMPGMKVSVSGQKYDPATVKSSRCTPPDQPTTSYPCLIVSTRMTATVKAQVCLPKISCLPVSTTQFAFRATVAVTMGRAWLISASGTKI